MADQKAPAPVLAALACSNSTNPAGRFFKQAGRQPGRAGQGKQARAGQGKQARPGILGTGAWPPDLLYLLGCCLDFVARLARLARLLWGWIRCRTLESLTGLEPPMGWIRLCALERRRRGPYISVWGVRVGRCDLVEDRSPHPFCS